MNAIQIKDNSIIKTGSYEINFSVDFNKSSSFNVQLGNAKESLVINLDKTSGYASIDRSLSGRVDFNNQFAQKIFCPFVPKTSLITDVQILVDKTSVELFLDQGDKVMTALFFPNYQYNTFKILGNNNLPQISNFKMNAITKSILR